MTVNKEFTLVYIIGQECITTVGQQLKILPLSKNSNKQIFHGSAAFKLKLEPVLTVESSNKPAVQTQAFLSAIHCKSILDTDRTAAFSVAGK